MIFIRITYEMFGGKQGYLQFEINYTLGEVKVVRDKSGKLKIVSVFYLSFVIFQSIFQNHKKKVKKL